MNQKKLIEMIDLLGDITKSEWDMLKVVIDRSFDEQQKELDKSIKLSASETKRVIQSQFEWILDLFYNPCPYNGCLCNFDNRNYLSFWWYVWMVRKWVHLLPTINMGPCLNQLFYNLGHHLNIPSHRVNKHIFFSS